MKMGAAKRNINPPLDVPHAGWGAQTHVFPVGYESDSYTTAVAIEDAGVWAIIATIDVTVFDRQASREIRRRIAEALGTSTDNIRITVSHSHACGIAWDIYYSEGNDAIANYIRTIVDKTVEAALEAADKRVAVTPRVGFGSCKVGVNRRQMLESGRVVVGANPDGVTDDAVGVISFEDESGSIVGTIVQYAMHPTTLGFANKLVSPDYPGELCRFVEKNIGGICLFLQGSAGNVGPGFQGFLDNIAAMRRLGATLGAEAVKTVLRLEEESYEHTFKEVVESGAPLGIFDSVKTSKPQSLKVKNIRVTIPLGNIVPLEEATATYESCKERLAVLQRNNASDEEIKDATYKTKRAGIMLGHSVNFQGKTSTETAVQFIVMGDTVLIGSEMEVFVETGLKIKELSPFKNTFMAGYSNADDSAGYIPTAKAFEEGGYEVDTSPYATDATDYLIRGIVAELHNLYNT